MKKKQSFTDLLYEKGITLLFGAILGLWAINTGIDISFMDYEMFSFLDHKITFKLLVDHISVGLILYLGGAEVKQHMIGRHGSLRGKKSLFAFGAALGGMVIPILILGLIFGFTTKVFAGFAVVVATDIIYANMVGNVVLGSSSKSKVLLMAQSIIDDLGTILILIFLVKSGGHEGSHEVNWYALLLTIFIVGLYTTLLNAIANGNRMKYVGYYAVSFAISYLGLMYSNMHPSLWGLLVVPFLPFNKEATLGAPGEIENNELDVMETYEHWFKPILTYALLGFGFCFASVKFINTSFEIDPFVILGISMSLHLGKLIGVSLGVYVIYLFTGKMPEGITWRHVVAIGLIAGLGFTMSVIAGSMQIHDQSLLGCAKIAALLSLLISPTLAILWKVLFLKKWSFYRITYNF